jgi:hypothetical protein
MKAENSSNNLIKSRRGSSYLDIFNDETLNIDFTQNKPKIEQNEHKMKF